MCKVTKFFLGAMVDKVEAILVDSEGPLKVDSMIEVEVLENLEMNLVV